MNRTLRVVLAGLFLTVSCEAATITAVSVGKVDVDAAIASAVDGDTVILPPGAATWTSKLVITKGISLIGNTVVSSEATTATGASLGVNVNTFTGSQTLHAISAAGFSAPGSLDVMVSTSGSIAFATVNFTAISGNDFTGCTAPSSTVTLTLGSPGVVNWTAHGIKESSPVKFSTTGALPTGITAGIIYYVVKVTTNSFQVASTIGGSALNFTGTQSGVQTCSVSGTILIGNNFIGQQYYVDNTVIQEQTSPRSIFVDLQTQAGKSYRVSGITFTSLQTTNSNIAYVRLYGTGAGATATWSDSVRIDHCHFKGKPMTTEGWIDFLAPVKGVIDHNIMEVIGGSGHQYFFKLNNGVIHNDFGCREWAKDNGSPADGSNPDGWGTSNWMFVEDNYLDNRAFGAGTAICDGQYAGGMVLRHNQILDAKITDHGTESGPRGDRRFDVYSNSFHLTSATVMTGTRTGTIISHDNTVDGVEPTDGMANTCDRINWTWLIGAWAWTIGPDTLNGQTEPHWDVIDKTTKTFTSANPALAGAPAPVTDAWVTANSGSFNYSPSSGVYATGTCSNAAASLNVMTDSSKTWATNQWQYFCVRRKSDGKQSFILSNDSNTLTVFYSGNIGTVNVQWFSGDNYEIMRNIAVLDQPGRGMSDLIGGGTTSFQQPQTTVAATSSGVNISSFTGTQKLYVAATTGFSTTGGILNLNQVSGTNYYRPTITYTGVGSDGSGKYFSGCQNVDNGTAVLATGNTIAGTYQLTATYGTRISGGPRDGTIQSPNQLLSPCYEWNDVFTPNGDVLTTRPAQTFAVFHEDREFFNQNLSYIDGTSTTVPTGIAVGTHTNRVGKPVTGVNGYDVTGVTANPPGTMFVESDTGMAYAWRNGAYSLYYQTHVYPHELVGGQSIPTFTSVNNATFGTNTVVSFSGLTTGNPTATLSYSGTLPTNSNFTDLGSGQFTISTTTPGIPNTIGSPFAITIHATNSQGTTDQSFTITVSSPDTRIIATNPFNFTPTSDRDVFINEVINNSGNSDLSVSAYGSDLSSPDVLSSTDTFPIVVSPNSFRIIHLTLTPFTSGLKTFTITYTSDATSGTNTSLITGTIINARMIPFFYHL